MKILNIVGARPNFIKAATLSEGFKSFNLNNKSRQFQDIVVHTGQHFDNNMSDKFFKDLPLPTPKYHFDFGGLNLSSSFVDSLTSTNNIIKKEKPDFVIVYGDTVSTLSGALAGKLHNVPIVHVEAGLRSYNNDMVEEKVRVMVDHMSDILFCPSNVAIENLKKENVHQLKQQPKIINSGDIMLEATRNFRKLSQDISFEQDINLSSPYFVVTVHRRENILDPKRLSIIKKSLNKIAEKINLYLPLHPHTAKYWQQEETPNIKMIPPLGYVEMLKLIDNCQGVITDSGGVQKEAYYLNKRCMILRDSSEWVELIDAGIHILAKMSEKDIFEGFNEINNNTKIPPHQHFYDQGKTSEIIINTLLAY